MNESSRAVAITGWGAVTSVGAGRAAHRDAVARSDGPRLTEVDRSSGYHRESADGEPRGSRMAALVDSSDFGEWLKPRAARRMSPPSRFAVVAARQALEQASEDAADDAASDDPPRTAVVTATSYGPASFTEELLRQIILESPLDASPFLFTEAVANAPAAQIALACTARGPNLTITQREAGPLLALARGAREVASGRVDRALVAAVDEMNPILHSVLDRYGALAGSRSWVGGDEVARPFDRDRDGYIAAEGAACLCLEPLDTARETGPVLARVATSIAGFDCEAPVAGWSRDPSTLARVLSRGLERAGVALESIDLIVSGAAGTRDGDRLEALVLRSVWAAHALPPIVAPKAWLGEQGGALLAGAALVCDLDQSTTFAATPGFRHVDEALGVVPHEGGPLAPRRVLVTALAPGGSAAWTVLERGGEPS